MCLRLFRDVFQVKPKNTQQYSDRTNRTISVQQQEYEQEIGFPTITPLTPRGWSTLVRHVFQYIYLLSYRGMRT